MSKLVFIDTETTSLRPDRRAWDIGLIERTPNVLDQVVDVEHQWFIETADLDLGNADPFALKIGRFYERHPQYVEEVAHVRGLTYVLPELRMLHEIERITRGAHLVGAVVSFDAEVLAARMRAHGICPSWHYHLIDVEALTVGYLNGRRARQNEIVDGYPLENHGESAPGLVRWNDLATPLPWKSDDLALQVGVQPASEQDRHTALGDARWARDIYDAIVN